MRMPHNETGEILLFKKPTVQLWLIFELTNMLSNTEGKKSTNRPPIKSQMFLIKAGSWHEDVVVGDWFETCKRWASCWLKSSLLFTDTCSAPTGFHCVLAQSFIRHWVSKHTMHRLKTVHTPQNPEIIWYLFVCLFFRKDIRTKLIL